MIQLDWFISKSLSTSPSIPIGYVVIPSKLCNLLSSFLDSAILLTSSVYIVWWSFLNLCYVALFVLFNSNASI